MSCLEIGKKIMCSEGIEAFLYAVDSIVNTC